MQTQGISLVTSNMSGNVSVKNTKASDVTFDSFMSSRASKVDTRYAASTVDSKVSTPAAKSGGKKQDVVDSHSLDEMSDSGKSVKKPVVTGDMEDKVNILDLSQMAAQMVDLLQEKFGLSDEEIQDMLTKLGIDLQFFALQMNWADGTMWPASVNSLQNLLMEFHGITDPSVFLTNSDLNQELTSLVEDMTDLLVNFAAETFEGDPNALRQLLAEAVQMETDGEDKAALSAQTPVDEDVADGRLAGEQEGFSVIVEDYTDGDAESDMADSGTEMGSQTSRRTDARTDVVAERNATASELFTERLAQAFEPDAEIAPAERSMVNIVEQVVRQVRIRVMSDTTSLELQLHPASLGRVSIQVSSAANGAATAVLAVENQMAKEALESQMIALKQTFEEQGLKVDAVEVTVSEFGLNREQHQAGQEQTGNQSKDRRFRADAGNGLEQEDEAPEVAEASRRDVNSTVDYTA
ncbi:MAG: flagellar hook-length control protein FliK [Lachnospiraceae bacterium]|nr:flagellar hook-length control protein FliK [Lachnospiraceae bacterium]